jgi:hypothetical protein
MPEPLHPPFAQGSTSIPRQLQRWLDINPQGGALTRCRYYITMPAFSQATNWIGVSDIVVAFNFEAPKAFSIPCNVNAVANAVPTVYNVVNLVQNQTGTIIGAEGGQGMS